MNYNGALDFGEGEDTDCEYRYDSDGALTYDGNRGITGITYDYGHHPSKIIMSAKKYITNNYTPDGRKLSSHHVAFIPNGNGTNRLDRVNGLNMYDFGARWYDVAGVPMWTSVDPLAEKYYHISPYAYCGGDPVNFVDPDGRSTYVINMGNGKYTVFGGNLEDKDKHIYEYKKNDDGVYVRNKAIGFSSSLTSFYDSDKEKWAIGSIIDTNDQSGINFLTNIVTSNISLYDYAANAGNEEKYDFKATNGTEEHYPEEKFYRGMPIGGNAKGEIMFSSARDIGNIAAGYVAGNNNLTWKQTRIAFDAYQSYTSRSFETEGKSSINAQYVGWLTGYNYNLRRRTEGISRIWKSIGMFFNSLF